MLIAAGSGCGRRGGEGAAPQTRPSDAGPTRSQSAPIDAAPALVVEDLQVGGDEAAFFADLGARPAWSGVIDRAELLERRGDSGALWGRAVEIDGQLRLVDESRGRGCLSVAVQLPDRLALAAPARVVLWGAWVGSAGHWVWRASRAGRLPDATGPPPEACSGLVVASGPHPDSAVAPSAVGDAGGMVLFVVVAPPDKPGDGWSIADAAGGEATARLLLPGEAEPYGGQDLRSDDERWGLEPGRSYAVEVEPVRRRRSSSLPRLSAIAAPIAVN